MGATGPVRIRLRWSGESDGRVSGTLAFRADVEPSPSEAMKGQLIRHSIGSAAPVVVAIDLEGIPCFPKLWPSK